MKKYWMLVVLCGVMPTMAWANNGVTTAIQLQQQCASRYDVDAGMCAGYIAAIADTLMQNSAPGRRVCLSPQIAPQTLVDNVMHHWRNHPPEAQDLASISVEEALGARFRCP